MRITIAFNDEQRNVLERIHSSKRNSHRGIHGDFSLIDGRQVDSVQESSSSTETDVPFPTESIHMCMHALYRSTRDTDRSIACTFAKHAKYTIPNDIEQINEK